MELLQTGSNFDFTMTYDRWLQRSLHRDARP